MQIKVYISWLKSLAYLTHLVRKKYFFTEYVSIKPCNWYICFVLLLKIYDGKFNIFIFNIFITLYAQRLMWVSLVDSTLCIVTNGDQEEVVLLRVPWTARRLNQSILKEINLEYSLEGLMLKLKFQYFGHLMRRSDSFEKTVMLETLRGGGEGANREWDCWMASAAQGTSVWANSRT